MDILKISLVAIIACIINIYFQSSDNKEYSLYIALTGGLLILTFSFNYIRSIFGIISTLADRANLQSEQIKSTFKIISTAYIAQFASDICRDANQTSLASKVDIAAKFIILYLSLPIIISFFNLLSSFEL